MSKRYVQHISGQGEKWEVQTECDGYWITERGEYGVDTLLTKLDYRLCEPPAVWRDVTAECELESEIFPYHNVTATQRNFLFLRSASLPGYRLRKVHVDNIDWAFIVERKVSE